MLAIVVMAVVARKSGFVLAWTDKIFAILLPVLGFCIAPIAYHRSINVSLTFLRDRITGRAQTVYTLVLNLVLLALILVLLDLSLRKAGFNPAGLSAAVHTLLGLDLAQIRPFRTRILIAVIDLPWRYAYMVVPTCAMLMLLVNIEYLLGCALRLVGLADSAHPPQDTPAKKAG